MIAEIPAFNRGDTKDNKKYAVKYQYWPVHTGKNAFFIIAVETKSGLIRETIKQIKTE
jgi:hypothetical protein